MIRSTSRSAQRGATLVVALIMLVLLTLMVATSFSVSTTNVQSVGNMQFRNEAVASANQAIEDSLGLTNIQPDYTVFIDVTRNGEADHSVALSRSCVGSTTLATSIAEGEGSSETLGFSADPNEYMVVWDYDAVVTDTATGASARVRQGIRQRLSQVQCDALCPPAPGMPCS